MSEIEDHLRMLKKAVDCLPIGITFSDIHGRIAEAEMHGFSVEELISRESREFAPPHLRKLTPPENLIKISVWSINVRKNGEEFPVERLRRSAFPVELPDVSG